MATVLGSKCPYPKYLQTSNISNWNDIYSCVHPNRQYVMVTTSNIFLAIAPKDICTNSENEEHCKSEDAQLRMCIDRHEIAAANAIMINSETMPDSYALTYNANYIVHGNPNMPTPINGANRDIILILIPPLCIGPNAR